MIINAVMLKDSEGVFAAFPSRIKYNEKEEALILTYDAEGWAYTPVNLCLTLEEVEKSKDYQYLIDNLNDRRYIVNIVDKSLIGKGLFSCGKG